MKIVFLGTNGWYDTDAGSTVSVLIDTKASYIILDAGFGFHKLGKHLKEDKPINLFISHLHLDHIIGLHTLPLFAHLKCIDIYAPNGYIIEYLRIFLDAPYTTPFSVLSSRVHIYDLEEIAPSGMDITVEKLVHSVPCYGFRFNIDGKIISYCTDTGVCDGLKKLAQDADILITECALKPGETNLEKPFHLNPENASAIAKEMKTKRLVLTHFDPGRYPALKDRKEAEKSASAIFKNTVAATDGYTIVL